jgi:phage tail sheath protein FI
VGELLAPGVYFEAVDRAERAVTPLRTDVAAFVGVAERGPLDRPTRIETWEQFRARFGGFLPGTYLAAAIKAFFDNGGRRVWVVRVAGDSARTAAGEVPGEGGAPSLRVSAESPGSWGGRLSIRVGRRHPTSTRARAVAQPRSGEASFVDTVVGFEPGALVRLVAGRGAASPAVAHRVVARVDAVRRLVTWDRPLPPGFVPPAGALFALEVVEFDLTVAEDDRPVEVWSGLGLAPAHPRYVALALGPGRSPRVVVEDLGAAAFPPLPLEERLPTLAALPQGLLRLTGGVDGLATLTPAHLTGEDPTGAPSPERRGLAALATLDEVAIVAIPDAYLAPRPPIVLQPLPKPLPDPCRLPCPPEPPALPEEPPALPAVPEQPPAFTREDAYRIQAALVAHCEALRDRIALLDPPPFAPHEAGALGEIQAWRRRFDSSYAALYHPWIKVVDPRGRFGAELVAQPPSGHVAGVYARTDLAVGVHKAPANAELAWAQDLAARIDEAEQELLNPEGVNCLRAFPGRGLRVYGSRTVSSDPLWRHVPVRRLLMMIEEALAESLAWAVFEPNDFVLRQSLVLSVGGFLSALWSAGALAGARPEEAFFVRCDEENNPEDAADRGELYLDIGVAPAVPAEFVVFRLGKTEGTFALTEEREGMR